MPLTRAEVVEAALALLNEVGLEGLTMRRLAKRLSVHHGGLYWHFPDKRALLGAMADRVLTGVAEIDVAAAPLDRLAEIARRTRAALLAHRDGARLVAGTYVREDNTLAAADIGVRALLDLGADPTEATLATFTIQEYVIGHTIEEQDRDRLDDDADSEQPAIDAARYPELASAVAGLPVAARGQDGFDYGLGLLLEGLRVRHVRRGR